MTVKPRSITPLVLIILISLAPVVFALLAYYVPALGLRPDGSNNYGTLVNPQRPVPAQGQWALQELDGKPLELADFHGQWVLLTADASACPESCVRKLFILRNSHASQGKDVTRMARVWFVMDDGPIDPQILDAYRGTHIVRADPQDLDRFLTTLTVPAGAASAAATESDTDTEAGSSGASADERLKQPMWVIDPLGNLMMEFPPQADPHQVRDDLRKLLRNSRIG